MSDAYVARDIHTSYTDATGLRENGYKVVDLSKFQAHFVDGFIPGQDVITTAIVPNYDGAILRIGYRGYGSSGTLVEDTYFKKFYDIIADTPRYQSGKFVIGVYFLSQAITLNEAREEVDFIDRLLLQVNPSGVYNDRFKLPVYIDVERSGGEAGRADDLTAAERTAIVKTWVLYARSRIHEHLVGIYASESWFKNNPADLEKYCIDATSFFTADQYSNTYSCWVAKYNNHTAPRVPGSLIYPIVTGNVHWEGWQYTNSEVIPTRSGYYTCDCSTFVKSRPWNGDPPGPDDQRVHLSDVNFRLDITDRVYYNGQPHTFNLFGHVQNPPWNPGGGYVLHPDEDYVIKSADMVNVPGKVVIEAVGSHFYVGETLEIECVAAFSIKEINLGDPKFVSVTSPVSSYTYDGTEHKPVMSVKFVENGNNIPQQDYITVYSNNKNAGTMIASVRESTVTENLHGLRDVAITIKPYSLSNATITLPDGDKYKYTGSAISPRVSITGAPAGIGTIASYRNNINVGTGTVVVTGSVNCSGTVNKNFRISYFDMSKVTINLSSKSFTYNGRVQVPTYTITDDDPILGVDYRVEYENIASTNVGTYAITFVGIGEYTGTQTVYYTITPKKLTDGYVGKLVDPDQEFLFRAAAYEPEVTIDGLIEDLDYRVRYANNINVGTAIVYFDGIGNYSDTIATNFIIDYNDILNCTAKYGFATMKSKYRVEDGTPMKLYADEGMHYPFVEKVDFVIEDEDMDAFDDFALVSFDVTGLGGIVGSATFRFRIIDEEPPGPYDFNDDGVYNFGDIDLQDETAVGGYTFDDKIFPDGTPNPEIESDEVTKDTENYDFDEMSTMYMANYDIDDGKNIDENGNTADEQAGRIGYDDDGIYNFEDIDDPDNPLNIPNNNDRNAHYDWGELGEDIEPTTVIVDKKDYDFNKFAGDIDQWVEPGTEYELDNTPIYSTYTIPTSAIKRSGLYFIYASDIKNNRVRVCASNNFVKKPAASSGWCRVEDLINLGEIVANDVVLVTGKIYAFPNGNGGYVFKTNEPMWVKNVLDPLSYEYNYELIDGYNGPTIGYANKASLRLPDYSNI